MNKKYLMNDTELAETESSYTAIRLLLKRHVVQ
jgi:hypothetical protein